MISASVPRLLLDTVNRKLGGFPVVGIVGPRQSGKTTFVREQLVPKDTPVTYLDLENPQHLARLGLITRAPESPGSAFVYLESQQERLVIIDEIQNRPELFTILRPLVDADRRAGRFILLGSASPALDTGAKQSLAGRISYSELGPLSLNELTDDMQRSKHWFHGGYPDSLLAKSEDISADWRVSYIEAYVTRDLPQLTGILQPDALRRLLRMLAAQQGELLNQSSLARALGVSQPTVRTWIDLMVQSFLVRSLQPFHINVKKRLVKSPKIYIRDSGLLHSLCQLDSREQLNNHTIVGASWEGYVIEQIAAIVSAQCQLYFYRTQVGAEMDLVLIGRQGRMACVEIKLSSSPSLSRGFHSAREDLGPEITLVVCPVPEGFTMIPGVEAAPLLHALDVLHNW